MLLRNEISARQTEWAALPNPPASVEEPTPTSLAIAQRVMSIDDIVHTLLTKDGKSADSVITTTTAKVSPKYWQDKEKKAASEDAYITSLAAQEARRKAYSRIPWRDIYEERFDPPQVPQPTLASDMSKARIIAGRTGLRDIIGIRYRTLCSVATAQTPRGAWPLVTADLLDDVTQNDFLLSTSNPDVVAHHPDTVNVLLSTVDESIPRLASCYHDTAAALQQRYNRELVAGLLRPNTLRLLRDALDWAIRTAFVYDSAKETWDGIKEQQRQEEERARAVAAEAERAAMEAELKAAIQVREEGVCQQIRDRTEGTGGRLQGAEDFVDRFDRNGDAIEGHC